MRDKTIGVLLALALSATGCGGDEGGNGGGGGSNKIDACAVVTADDASSLFGQTAEKESGAPSVDPALLGECQWGWADANANSHTLQFRVWEGEQYYVPGSKAEPFAIGDKGVVESDPTWGVDVSWVQGNKVADLSYSTVGISPDATTKLDAVKALALSASAKLK
ncbi:MAG: hypothetical protein IPM35_07315 [Myxococcales bacterium]|nr:hypothetical protein [Myxococcales bacterium]